MLAETCIGFEIPCDTFIKGGLTGACEEGITVR
jgi:hypothetical protein